MLQQNQEVIINEVFEAVRDASSAENARAIQDSESNVAQEMKKIVNTLAKKGWSKNEIVYEL
jgi:cytochrome c-type biogenesis protein CcmH/NrfF